MPLGRHIIGEAPSGLALESFGGAPAEFSMIHSASVIDFRPPDFPYPGKMDMGYDAELIRLRPNQDSHCANNVECYMVDNASSRSH